MKSKLKGSTHNFEKFSTSSSKNVKFATKKVKKAPEVKNPQSSSTTTRPNQNNGHK
jgi:hypothetical protein